MFCTCVCVCVCVRVFVHLAETACPVRSGGSCQWTQLEYRYGAALCGQMNGAQHPGG